MKLELDSASNFLVYLVTLGHPHINRDQLEWFQLALVQIMRRRYHDRWHTDNPLKGNGYRAIRLNGVKPMDPVIRQAGEICGFSTDFMYSAFPSDLTIWVDPKEVSFRLGGYLGCPVVILYEEGNQAWQPDSNFPQPRKVNN